MAKGENLEKPKKKGGMVIVIGMGAKPKNMKKSFGRGSDDAKLAQRNKMLNRLKSGRNNIEDILGKRRVDSDEFHGEFRHRFGMDFDEYLNSEKPPNINLQELIDDMAERAHSQRRQQGREESKRAGKAEAIRNGLLDTQRFKGALRSNGIDEDTWLRHVKGIADDDLTDNTFNDLMSRLRDPDAAEQFDDSPDAAFRDRDERQGYDKKDKSVDRNDEDPDEMFNRLTRIFETRGYHNPMQAALESMQPLPQGRELGAGGFNPEEETYGDVYGGRTGPYTSVRNEPSTVFSTPFQGSGQRDQGYYGGSKHAPKGSVEAEYYGFRGPSPIVSSNKRTIEDEEADMDAVEDNMYRSSSDSTNVMDAAWALLKGNPDMLDAEGDAVPPAAMNYAQQARALEDSLDYQGGKRRGVAAPDMRDGENTSRFRQALKNVGFRHKKIGGENMQEHHDFARERSKRDTSEYMENDNEGGHFGPDPQIQRMPRPEE